MGKKIILFFLIVIAMILGDVIAELAKGGFMDFLAIGKSVGITQPFTMSAVGISLTFGFMIDFNVAQILCLIIAVAFYPKVVNALFS